MRRVHLLMAIVAGLMIVQSGLGLLFSRQYRDVDWVKATWFGNDWVTLAAAAPLLIVSARMAARRGSTRGMVTALGALGYAAYNYAYYLFGAALNAFFPIYVAALVLSVVTLILALSAVDVPGIAARFAPATPVKLVGGYYVCISVGLASVWLWMWAAYAFEGRPTPVPPEAFKLVAALDLSVLAMALGSGGVLLWQRRPWGYAIATIAGVFASIYLLVLCVNSAVAVRRGLAEPPGELPVWGTLIVATLAATLVLVGHVRDRPPDQPVRHSVGISDS
jgi:hypothetical protein